MPALRPGRDRRPGGPAAPAGDGDGDALALAREEAEHWRREAEEARVGAARAEAEAGAQRELAGELMALLADARRPFWRRWIG